MLQLLPGGRNGKIQNGHHVTFFLTFENLWLNCNETLDTGYMDGVDKKREIKFDLEVILVWRLTQLLTFDRLQADCGEILHVGGWHGMNECYNNKFYSEVIWPWPLT